MDDRVLGWLLEPEQPAMRYLASRVRAGIDWLVDHQLEDGGWDCYWRGKGNLDSWEALSAFAEIPPARRSSDVREAIRRGSEFFLQPPLRVPAAPRGPVDPELEQLVSPSRDAGEALQDDHLPRPARRGSPPPVVTVATTCLS